MPGLQWIREVIVTVTRNGPIIVDYSFHIIYLNVIDLFLATATTPTTLRICTFTVDPALHYDKPVSET